MLKLKLFAVAKVWNHDTTPSIVAHFVTKEDAMNYAKLARKSDLEHKYAIYKLIMLTK